jgi:23S rRNA pseudouridine1911/1915/1917 synthase
LSREGKLNSRKCKHIFSISPSQQDERLDVFLAGRLSGCSRSLIQKHCNSGSVLVNHKEQKKPHYRLKTGDIVEYNAPEATDTSLLPANIKLEILHEDDDIIVLNKQPGIPVHPSHGHNNDTIVNALLYYMGAKGSLSTIGGEKRPGIVHRLDKDTSGILLIAKNNLSHDHLTRQFAERKTYKVYVAIVKGIVSSSEGVIDKPLMRSPRNRKKFTIGDEGRDALTHYSVIDSETGTSLVRFVPKTGRTHQIRVHAASIGHPILGDPLYARKSRSLPYLMLVAKELGFTHPRTEKNLHFTAPYPSHFLRLAQQLGYDLKNR